MSPLETTFDLVEELRLRRWARENYMPLDDRDMEWPSVVLDEMRRRDAELAQAPVCRRRDIVPLPPMSSSGERPHILRGPFTAAARSSAGELHYT